MSKYQMFFDENCWRKGSKLREEFYQIADTMKSLTGRILYIFPPITLTELQQFKYPSFVCCHKIHPDGSHIYDGRGKLIIDYIILFGEIIKVIV